MEKLKSNIYTISKSAYTKIVVLCFFLIPFNLSYGADITEEYLRNKAGNQTISSDKWNKLKQSYQYTVPKPDTAQKKQETAKPKKTKAPVFGDAWLKVLSYICVFLIILGLFYLLIKYLYFNTKEFEKSKLSYLINEDPEDINDLEIDPLLAAALKSKDYKMATRLRFLGLLQQLHQKNHIRWKREYTNQIYKQQLWNNPLHNPFKELCFIYESIWYGNYPINSEGYTTVDQKFNSTFQSIVLKK